MQEITYNGKKYAVKALTMRDVLPVYQKDGANFTEEIAKLSITVDGKPIGDGFLDLPIGIGQRLLTQVNDANSFNSGKD